MSNPFSKSTDSRSRYMTLEQVAEIMGITRERVRQLEASALMKCRSILRKKGVSAEDFFSTLKYNKPIKPSEEGASPENYELMYERKENND